MASSHLISAIGSAIKHLALSGRQARSLTSTLAAVQLKIELRNLKVQLVICFRMLSGDLPSRFSGIEGAIARIVLQDVPSANKSSTDTFKEWIHQDALPEVRGFAKQLADECYTSLLAVEDIVVIIDSILDNVADFWVFVDVFGWEDVSKFAKIDVIDDFVEQVTFLKCLLVFAMETGVELQHLMIHIQPFVSDTGRVFMRDQPRIFDNWYEEVHFHCSTVIGSASQAYEAYTKVLSLSCTTTFCSVPAGNLENFLDSLISLLWDVLRHHTNSRVMDQLKVLYEGLRFCRSILKSDGEMRDQIGAMICDAGMLVCLLHHRHVEISYPDQLSELLERFGVLQPQVENSASAPTTGDSAYMVEDIEVSDGNEETHPPQRSTSAPQVARFQDDEVDSVLDRLMRGSKHLQILPICGMPGLGKTTFASALYNHRSTIYHFQARAWGSVSQVLDVKKFVLELLSQLLSESGSYSEMTEADLANKLRQSLKGKRYLIILDDVWATEAWHSLVASFPDDYTQSRVIVTSRHRDVIPDQQPHLLRLRDDNECLEIINMKLSHKKGWTSEFGMTIAKMCKGLPLTAVIVAGLLDTTKQQGWHRILDHLSSGGVSGEKQCNSILELSFNHLPNDLKLCFLYFAAFSEDEEISVKRLLRLWIGEGFVRESKLKRTNDVAREYMENLIQRSLVMVARNRSIGGVKTCRIHDLIHDFCLRRAKQENFFHILSERGDELLNFNEPPNLQRLSIRSDAEYLKKAKLFCPRACSMFLFTGSLFNMVFIVQAFKFVTVLDMLSISLGTGIPSEIELLTQLRYLSASGNQKVIPSSLGNLANLETLIGEFLSRDVIPFPHTFWNLHNLKWLNIKRSTCPHVFTLPTEDLENSCALLELETICGVVFNSHNSMEQEMRKFPNVCRLKCSILPGGESTADSSHIVILDSPNQLQCLSISGEGRLRSGFGSSESLRRLSLRGFELSREVIADIGKLPNLEVLKLRDIVFWGGTLDMEEGEFLKLRHLKMVDMEIKSWTVSDELPCLQKLKLYKCKVSEELPSDCLETSATLEEIQVSYCSPNVEDFAREIQEAQEDYGNSVKVHIQTKE